MFKPCVIETDHSRFGQYYTGNTYGKAYEDVEELKAAMEAGVTMFRFGCNSMTWHKCNEGRNMPAVIRGGYSLVWVLATHHGDYGDEYHGIVDIDE